MGKKFLPTTEAVQLLFEGQQTLSQVESVGCRIDKDYLEFALDDTARQINVLEREMRDDPDFRHWQKRFGADVSFTTNRQLAAVVFGELGFPRKPKRGDDSDTDEEQEFAGITIPLVKNFFEAQKLRKGRSTYLLGIQREMVQHDDGNWYVHPSYHLNTVSSFRSSCSDPNYTNLPNRNPVIAEIVRKCYVARPGQQILEIDEGQLECRSPCPYTLDGNLISYMSDPSRDMHRDMAAQIFMLSEKEGKQKNVRQIAKNKFVFPAIYGAFYKQSAAWMWEALVLENVNLGDTGKTVIQHLAEKGITELGPCDTREEYEPRPGTFERYVRDVEADFWQKRFPTFAQWKKDWVESYRREGGCRFKTGFVMVGPHKKNDITNYCSQCDAFHYVLLAMGRINRFLRKKKFKTRVIGEIHDCLTFDCDPKERDDVIELSVKAMTTDVMDHWKWINVPLIAEVEACPVDGSWFDKRSLKKANGTWVPADADKWNKQFGAWF